MSRTLSFTTEAFDPQFYSPVKLEGSERINQLYSYTLIIKTPDKDGLSSALQDTCASADLTSWLGQNIHIGLELDGKNVIMSEVVDTIHQNWNQHIGKGSRVISGIISEAKFLYDQGRSSYYALTIAPKLIETTLRSNYRIYQDQTVVEVLRGLIEPYALTVEWRLQNIFNQMKTDNKTHEQLQQEVEDYSPVGFTKPVMVAAADAGLALVSPQTIQEYSGKQHSITTGGDLNISTGQSWLASIADKLSFFVYQGVKIFSGKGKIEIQAQNNNLELIADKTVKVISASDKVEVAAKKEILITCCGAYIRIKDGDIEIHAPGKVEHKGGDHPFLGPASLDYHFQAYDPGNDEMYVIKDEAGNIIPNFRYKLEQEGGDAIYGATDENGQTLRLGTGPDKLNLSIFKDDR